MVAWVPNSIQNELMQQFGIRYGEDASSWHPLFGGKLLPLLNQEHTSLSGDGLYLPTSEALLSHCGYLQRLQDNAEYYNALMRHPDELRARIRMAKMEMDGQVIQPVRKHLEPHGMYLYRGPNIKITTNDITGTLDIKKQKGPQLVKLLPIDSDMARLYGYKTNALRLIAPEVVYVLDKRKLSYRTVKEEDQLLKLVDGWMKYVMDIRVREKLWASFQKKAPSAILTHRVEQKFLLQPKDVMMSTKQDIRRLK